MNKKVFFFLESRMFRFFNIERYKLWTIKFPFHLCPSIIQIFFGWPLLYYILGHIFPDMCFACILSCIVFFSPPSKYGIAYISVLCLFYLPKLSVRLVNLYCISRILSFFFPVAAFILTTYIKTYCWFISFRVHL